MKWKRIGNQIIITLNEANEECCPICTEKKKLIQVKREEDLLVLKEVTNKELLCKQCLFSLAGITRHAEVKVDNDIPFTKHGPLLPTFSFPGSEQVDSYLPRDELLIQSCISMHKSLVEKSYEKTKELFTDSLFTVEEIVKYFSLDEIIGLDSKINIPKEYHSREYLYSYIEQYVSEMYPYIQKHKSTIDNDKLEETSIRFLMSSIKRLSRNT